MKPQEKRLRKLKPSDESFVNEYVTNGFNGTQAVRKVFRGQEMSETYTRVKAHELLTRPNIMQAVEVKKNTLKDALIKQGITPAKIAKKIDVLLEAKEPIFKNNNSTGEVEEVGEKIDFTAVDKGLKHATAIYGVEDPEQPKTGSIYNFFFNPEIRAEVNVMEDRIKSLLKQKKPENA